MKSLNFPDPGLDSWEEWDKGVFISFEQLCSRFNKRRIILEVLIPTYFN